jgi:hypothetical protein
MIPDALVEPVLQAIEAHSHTGNTGDGSIFVIPDREGRQRWHWRSCGRWFGVTTGLPRPLRTSSTEVARALLVVFRQGSLAAAEKQTGHKDETIGRWLRAAPQHAPALTEVLAQEMHLSESEIEAFWSFVAHWRPRVSRTKL